MVSEKQIEAAAKAMETLALERGFVPWDEAASVDITAAEQAEPAPDRATGAVKMKKLIAELEQLTEDELALLQIEAADEIAAILSALEHVEPAPAAEPFESCPDCAGSGYSNHPDSGQVCHRCNGQGSCTHPTPSEARLREALVNLVQEIDDLVSESEGVAGLHLNGDVAEWGDLLPGGPYERLSSLDDARRVCEGGKVDG